MNKESTHTEIGLLDFTPAALQEIDRLKSSMTIPPGYLLRVGIRGGGCAGPSNYILGFDEPKADDQRYISGELEWMTDRRHAMHVLGMEIDFIVEEDGSHGFVFNNPAAREDVD